MATDKPEYCVPEQDANMPREWTRLFPELDHRWTMGLRPVDSSATFFADQDASGATRAERERWLASDPQAYAALWPEAEESLQETIAWARHLGTDVPAAASPWDQLLALGRAWEPDFVWMQPDADADYRLIGGVVCFPSSWALKDKVGRPIRDVHAPVPGLNDALGRQIDTFLAKLAPEQPWRRENWSLRRDAERNHHPSIARPRLDETIQADEVWLRVEHQLLVKLPRCGSVLFGIRIELVPLAEVLADPVTTQRLARNLATMSPEAAGYKDLLAARPALLRMLTPPAA